MQLKAVGFDLDDTLYSRKDFYHKVYNVMQSSVITIDIPFDTFYKEFQYYSDIEYEKFMERKKNRDDYKNDRVIDTYKKFGVEVSLNDAIIFNSLYLYFANTIEYRNGVVTLLNKLTESNVELFILTNGPSDDQRRKLKQLGIEEYISKDKWFISDEINYTKPDVKIFQIVERNLELTGNDILYIGDDLENDVIGAKKANWQSIYLNVHDENFMDIDTMIANDYNEISELLFK